MTGSKDEAKDPAATGRPEPRPAELHDIDGENVVFRAVGGSLYVVATPLGNLRDVTLRALDILRTADTIAAEDTRVSATLLRHYGIDARMLALHAHNEASRAPAIVDLLRAGRSVALVTDAGTPGLSDPGARVAALARSEGFPVVPIPGPNAAIAAVSAAGLRAARFVFAGFLGGNAKQRERELRDLARVPHAVVFYEAPHRVVQTVREIARVFDTTRPLVIARELTKRFESIATVELSAAAAWLEADADRTRGEFVLIVDVGTAPADVADALDDTSERWLTALLEHLSPAQAARIASAVTGVARDTVYARAIALRPDRAS